MTRLWRMSRRPKALPRRTWRKAVDGAAKRGAPHHFVAAGRHFAGSLREFADAVGSRRVVGRRCRCWHRLPAARRQRRRKIKDSHLQARATLELGTALVHSVRGYDDEGAILLRQSTELARQSGSASIAAAGFRELGYVEALAGRRPAAAAYLSSAVEPAADGDSLAGIHGVIGFNLVDWGQVGEGLEHFEISLDHARKAGNRRREIWSLGLGAWGLLAADRLQEADAWLETCLVLSDEQSGLPSGRGRWRCSAKRGCRQRKDPATLRPGSKRRLQPVPTR